MKTVILYYTFGGATMTEAERLGKELESSVYRIREIKKRCLFTSFIPGGFQAMQQKKVPVTKPDVNLDEFDDIMIGCPIWANYPAPAFNSIVSWLPKGKHVELFFMSGSGNPLPNEKGIVQTILDKGCEVVSIRNVKTGKPPHKMKEK